MDGDFTNGPLTEYTIFEHRLDPNTTTSTRIDASDISDISDISLDYNIQNASNINYISIIAANLNGSSTSTVILNNTETHELMTKSDDEEGFLMGMYKMRF